MEFTQEIMQEAYHAETADDLVSLANRYDISLSENDAAKCFAYLHDEGELTDDQLDDIVGGKGGLSFLSPQVLNLINNVKTVDVNTNKSLSSQTTGTNELNSFGDIKPIKNILIK